MDRPTARFVLLQLFSLPFNYFLSFFTDESKPVRPMDLQGLFRSPVSSRQPKIAPFKESSSLRQRQRRRATGGPKDFL